MFKNTIVAIALLASSAWAITFTSAPSTVVAGQTYNLQWSPATGPVTILLRKGDPANLQTVGTITAAGVAGSYSWTAPASFAPGADYAFQITEGTETNYYGPFVYSGGVAASSAAAPSSAPASVSSVAVSASASVSAASSGSVSSVSSYPTLTPSGYKNVTSSTLKPSSSSLIPSAAKPSASIVSANSAVAIGSPLALVFSAVAAMLYLQ